MLIISCLTFCVLSCTSKGGVEQPVLGSRTVKIIKEKDYKFKDLNKNGKLDIYEDWRLSPDQRSKDLLSKMSVEEKVGFMLISATRLKNDWSYEESKTTGTITSDFNEEDLEQGENIFTRVPLPVAIMTSAGTTKGVTQYHLRHFTLNVNLNSRMQAEWSNKLQALCESTPLGIPALVASNTRNHISGSAGTVAGVTSFSMWPDELGLSATRDLPLIKEFADIVRKEWIAVGLRKGYMYSADLSTEPRWQKVNQTFGENADWTGKIISEVVLGLQGDQLNSESVALTINHFPGGGASKAGLDPHFAFGKSAVFPGKMFTNNLIPFEAAIEAGASAIMPCYSVPVGTEYEEVAYAFNKGILTDLLRGKLGFKGIINTETGPIGMMPWGVEKLTIYQRYKKAIEAGVNLFAGTADPQYLMKTVKDGMVDMSLIDSSVVLLLKEQFKLGLFENPYVDEDAAVRIVGNKKFVEKANIAMRKSIVLLRNENNFLPIKEKKKVYFEIYEKIYGTKLSGPGDVYIPTEKRSDVEFVKTPQQADVILLWIKPMARPLYTPDDSPLEISLSKCSVDVGYINNLTYRKPTVLAINYSNPWVIDEIYNDKAKGNIKGVLATFGTTPEAILDIITGVFNPSAKMPFTTPISNKAVLTQKEDVPGYLEGDAYPLFKYDEGLSYAQGESK